GKQSSKHTHHQGEENAHHQQVERNFEREGQIGERLKVHGVGGPAIQRQDRETAQKPTQERNHQGFEEKRQDHHPCRKAHGAHGGNLAATLGNGRIHGVERTEDRTDGHNGRDQAAEHSNQAGHGGGLFGVVINLAPYVDVHSGVGSDRILELLEIVG